MASHLQNEKQKGDEIKSVMWNKHKEVRFFFKASIKRLCKRKVNDYKEKSIVSTIDLQFATFLFFSKVINNILLLKT